MRKKSEINRVATASERITNIFATREERVKLLRRGLFGTQIEKLYNETNSIFILNTDWQDGHVTGFFFMFFDRTSTIPYRHVSSPVSEPCAVKLRK